MEENGTRLCPVVTEEVLAKIKNERTYWENKELIKELEQQAGELRSSA